MVSPIPSVTFRSTDLILTELLDFIQTVLNANSDKVLVKTVYARQKPANPQTQLMTDIGVGEMPALIAYYDEDEDMRQFVFNQYTQYPTVILVYQCLGIDAETIGFILRTISKAIAYYVWVGHDASWKSDASLMDECQVGMIGKIEVEKGSYFTAQSKQNRRGVLKLEVSVRTSRDEYQAEGEVVADLKRIGFVFNPTDPNRPFDNDNVTPVSDTKQGAVVELPNEKSNEPEPYESKENPLSPN